MSQPVNSTTQGQALARSYGIKGGISLRLDDVVVPVELVGNSIPDTALPWAIAYALAAPAGATFSVQQIWNPAGSGALIVVKAVSVRVTGAGVRAFLTQTEVTATDTTRAFFQDFRAIGELALNPYRPVTLLNVADDLVAALTGNLIWAEQGNASGDTVHWYPDGLAGEGVTLTPGSGMSVSCNNATKALTCSWSGIVYPITAENEQRRP